MEHHQIDRLAEELLIIISQMHRMMTTEVRLAAGNGASVPQLRLLTELVHGPQTMTALARHQYVSTQAVCDLVHDMVERGWLSRVPNEYDRRQQLLCVTEAGRVAFVEARAQALRQLAPRLEELSEAELHVLAAAVPAMQRMVYPCEPGAYFERERPGRKPPPEA